MLWILSLHLIFMVTWFSGLFYLPRLYVYHAMSSDQISIDRFKIMERKLFYGIMTPGAVLTTFFGIWLLTFNWDGYSHMGWMHAKLLLVMLMWVYHIYLWFVLRTFKCDKNTHSHKYYRFLNEVPVIFLVLIIFLVILKP